MSKMQRAGNSKQEISQKEKRKQQEREKQAEELHRDKDKILKFRQEHKLLREKVKRELIFLTKKMNEKLRKLNSLKHTTSTQCKCLEKQNTEFNTLIAAKPGLLSEQDSKNLRVLENRLEQTKLKSEDAENITQTYQKIKQYLQEANLKFPPRIDQLDIEVCEHRSVLKDVHEKIEKEQRAKDVAKEKLHKLKLKLDHRTTERENELDSCRRREEEMRGVHIEDESSDDELFQEMSSEEEREVPSPSFEDTITKAKRVTEAQTALNTLIHLRDTNAHLEKLKEQYNSEFQQLESKHSALTAQRNQVLTNKKYSGIQNERNRILEEKMFELQEAQQKRDAAKKALNRITETLNPVCYAVEHLHSKVQYIELQDIPEEEQWEQCVYPLNLMEEAKLKILILVEELKEHDIPRLMKDMKEEKFLDEIEKCLPESNTRIALPDQQPVIPSEEDEDSDEEDLHTKTRALLKQKSELALEKVNTAPSTKKLKL